MSANRLQKEIRRYQPALFLDRVFPKGLRRHLLFFFGSSAAFLGLLSLIIWYLRLQATASPLVQNEFSILLLSSTDVIFGALALLTAGWLVVFMMHTFSAALYFRGIETIVHEGGVLKKSGGAITYEVARTLELSDKDITSLFIGSSYGSILLTRLGINKQEQEAFLSWKHEHESFTIEHLTPLPQDRFVDLEYLADFIFEEDESFSEFLFSHGVGKDEFFGALEWIVRSVREEKHDERWWGRDNLGRIPGVGQDWAYGGAYTLQRYAKNMQSSTVFASLTGRNKYAEKKVEELEEILLKAKEANALLIGEEGVGKMDIVSHLYERLKEGDILPPLADKRMVVLDTNLLVSSTGEKGKFEREIRRVFNDAIEAGNIILVIENMPSFIRSVSSLGSEVADLIDAYLSSPNLQVIGTATPAGFHTVVEAQSQLVQRFDNLYIDASDLASTIRILEDLAVEQETEMSGSFFFTYPAIQAVAETADRYLVEGVMPDKAIDLLLMIGPHAREQNIHIITEEVILDVVRQKTGMPVGELDDKERKLLSNLEEILHRRVVGQDEAIASISGALRRARAGVRNPDRPIGSFLFLGPTGVGKTETTKALAAAYFGGEESIQRIDMSEYNTADSLERLIGSFEREQPGVLSNMLRENPYGVLLLDEFEKAHEDVHDLFLQTLDEGYFSDMRGRKVNARNLIIIATSNAGSDLIWELVQDEGSLNESKDTVIDTLVDQRVYKPELLNRFDGVVLFHPLTKEDLKSIARILLGRLQKRVEERGYKLSITQPLIDLLVEKGYDPKFGARPMNRVIQEDIEEAIADKVIAGQLKKGDTISFTEEELATYT